MKATRKTLWLAIAAALASGPAFGSGASVTQVGTDNEATVEQASAPAAMASVVQNGTENSAAVTQSNSGYYMGASVNQFGSLNSATVSQENSWAGAGVFQFGDDNTAVIDQADSYGTNAHILQGGGAYANSGTINQAASDFGVAQIVQTNTTGSTAQIDQSGFNNRSYVAQDYSWYATANIDQGGSGNLANISQTDGSHFANGYVYQAGLSDAAMVTQTAAYASGAAIYQLGAASTGENTAEIVQTNVSYSRAGIAQWGDGNDALITQENGSNLIGHISQNGVGNSGDIYQTGVYNYASVSQGGTANTASITQVGAGPDSNQAWISQVGTGHVATTYQSGSGNFSSIWQH